MRLKSEDHANIELLLLQW